MTGSFTRLLARVQEPDPPPFALLHRPHSAGDQVELLLGEVSAVPRLADLPLPESGRSPGHEVLALVPYRQLSERGFPCHDDGTPLLAMTVREQASGPVSQVLRDIHVVPITVSDPHFDVSDEDYAKTVRRVLDDEIGQGAGANFVIKRTFVADVADWSPRTALTLFRRMLATGHGVYWTFVVHTGERTLVGATPERHITLNDATVVMNPISGTLRYPPGGPKLPDVMSFLADPKEAGELSMVVDEELKMMARLTHDGGRLVGPFLKEMATLAHTEYLIEGRSSRDVRDILRETLFAPTVTGSPLESACHVIHSYESGGRGYYSGVAALIGRDATGARELDSAILIRTAEIRGGRLEFGVGTTLVRDSQPFSEVAETWTKASGMLTALGVHNGRSVAGSCGSPGLAGHPEVRRALRARNTGLAAFWLADRERPVGRATGHRALVVDAEDTFTAMLGHQLRALGLRSDVRRFDEPHQIDGYDLVVMGPGPGDPRERSHPKIAHLSRTLQHLLHTGTPFLAVCLSHQLLGRCLGFDVVRRPRPNQGVQQEIDFFGRRVRMGFYNTFAVVSDSDRVGEVEVSRDPLTGEVHGLRGPRFRSFQFHAESVLSQHGLSVLADAVDSLLPVPCH
ncbi:anthranilate synthase family protein [Kutzneria sp. CA-103260]|uniref:anthranilate synthase family protein n=1 Tax=Kutzneria sp. CA-103260 TaxID=2802641 RepID=UPI001BAB179E|nr:anthranilate synthase family protein [Kutzneria sp. CA-103260]QUQ64455.1 phenazine-specific anthranilate synthase component I [Kutzneria sp. CA-103260]